MQLKDHHREERAFSRRAIIAGVLVILALLLLIGRLAQLQVVEHAHFTTLSKDNRVRLLPVPPTRGLIYDREGQLLAVNRPAYNLELIPEQVPNLKDTLQRLGKILPISADDLDRFYQLKAQTPRFDSVPILTNITLKQAAAFAVVRQDFPGVDIKAQLMRHYPFGAAAAHVVGYVGRISQKDLEHIDISNYAGSSYIGKTGLEQSYEKELHGKVGIQQVEVNSAGRVERVLGETPPTPGLDLHLTLDMRLQEVALKALGKNDGAVVAIDTHTGGVLVMASTPSYDPNLFVQGISTKDYAALRDDPNRPLYNRALRGQYPPGSTIKPFIGLGGLETGTITPNTTVFCPGYYQLPGHTHKYFDWKRSGHGVVDLSKAITESCDVFYYTLAHEMGVDKLSHYLAQFNFGRPTGIDELGEASGILPSRAWKQRTRHQPWYPGETVIMGIGQGYWLVTPLQLAAATAALANDGSYYTPHLVAYLQRRGTDQKEPITPKVRHIPVKNIHDWQDVHAAMENVVNRWDGTATRIRTDYYVIAGKTGTAQVFTLKQGQEYRHLKIAKKLRDQALFIAFAPAQKPQIAIAVIVEHGGDGGAAAAPVARKVMDAYLLPRLGINPHNNEAIPQGKIKGEE